MATRIAKAIIAVHRYLGTLLCLVFLAWFASGIVMMYTGYPLLSESEKLARMPRLDAGRAGLSPAEAWQRTARAEGPADVRLGMLAGRPVYRFATHDWRWVTVRADDGQVLPDLDAVSAATLAREFAPGAPRLEHRGRLDTPDQWTIFSLWAPHMAGQRFSPVHKFTRGDGSGTEIYIAAATGDVVQATTRRERFWGYVGPVVHWIYPTSLRAAHPDGWDRVVVWVSAIGLAMSASGLIVGVYRWRRRPGVPISPFRGWMLWHHYLGLAFGVLAFTWVFSGLLSMDPWSWSRTDDSPDGSHQDAMRGGALDLAAVAITPAQAVASCDATLVTKELRLTQLRGAPYYWCVETPERSRLVDAKRGGDPVERLPLDVLVSAAGSLLPHRRIVSSAWLSDYDAYYYPGWYDKVVRGRAKRLPVLRLEFDDPGRTLVYVDPHSAVPLLAYDTSSRWYRWLFHGLHSFDVGWLYRARPLWDVVVLPLMLGGVLLSATGCWVGVAWLRRTWRAPVARRRLAVATRPNRVSADSPTLER
jgi:hypothetical protein